MVSKGDLILIGILVGLALGVVIAVLLFLFLRWYKKRVHLQKCAANEQQRSPTSSVPIRVNGFDASTDFSASITIHETHLANKVPSPHSSWWSRPSKDHFVSMAGVARYSYKDIQKATQNFTTSVGQGSFGVVFKAVLPSGETYAVKVLASSSKQGEKEFQTEVCLLGRLHHRNLVNLIGYCVDKGQRMLIYEFMSNGSLANLLYNNDTNILSWEDRLQIALDISHGIEYLHEGAVPPVIHRDLKSANILLDQSMRAKVADFGLSKEDAFDEHTSGIKGTYGYIDPVYIATNRFTTKSDIYSFGVIIFELITGIHPHQNLMEYVNLVSPSDKLVYYMWLSTINNHPMHFPILYFPKAGMSSDGVDEIVDEKLAGKCEIEEVRELANIGKKCLHKFQRKRPMIGEVSQAILKIRQRRRLVKQDTMSTQPSFSRVLSRIQSQHIELSRITSFKDGDS
ncbi:Calcium/calmodulin-regulated receptor-like kinase 2 [Linum grandiflorum]